MRHLYLKEGLSYLPATLELVDRNRLSRTYGCFDRSYWHYRTSDFPSGMYQEAVLSLAMAHELKAPDNPFYRQERVRELVIAGIDFAHKSAHKDGSCDDYFPYERASGATAFSLYACTESYMLLGLNEPEFLDFFRLRGRYLSGYGFEESGLLSNHKALMALAIYNVYLASGDEYFRQQAQEKIRYLLSLQTSEGWFPEYEGCDPGYLTFTIDFLAKYFQKSEDQILLEPLRKAVEFASWFMHPDGSFGGEYGSRNTFHFLPHGFEIMSSHSEKAATTADAFLQSLEAGTRSRIDDDRIFTHYVYNFLMAYRDYCEERADGAVRNDENSAIFFSESKLLVKSSPSHYAVFSTGKGGIGKIFRNGKLALSDAGITGRTVDGEVFHSQIMGNFRHSWEDPDLIVEGSCYHHSDQVFTPFLFVMFRAFLLFVGRFFPANVVRKFLQKKTIVKKEKEFPIRFQKRIHLEDPIRWECTFYLEDPSVRLNELWLGSDPTFIYIATSQPYQSGTLTPWVDLSSILPELHQTGTATLRIDIR